MQGERLLRLDDDEHEGQEGVLALWLAHVQLLRHHHHCCLPGWLQDLLLTNGSD